MDSTKFRILYKCITNASAVSTLKKKEENLQEWMLNRRDVESGQID